MYAVTLRVHMLKKPRLKSRLELLSAACG